MLFHFHTRRWFGGGFIGVDVFFVLSGFLITKSLLDEWDASGVISLRHFYARRALRLLPAALLFFAVYAAFAAMISQSLGDVRLSMTSLGFGLAYVFNWYVALGHEVAPALIHIWSLAVEEQFYLLAPALLLAALTLRLRPAAALAFTLALAAASMVLPLAIAGLSWSRLYYATDYRAHELLFGSAAAQLARLVPMSSLAATKPFRALAAFSAVALVAFTVLAEYESDWLLAGGFTLAALTSCAVVVACAFAPDARLARILESRSLVYLGERSYALYLWHLPIAIYTAWLAVLPQLLVGVPLSLGAAELSYRLVERRALRRKDALRPSPLRASPVAPGGTAPPRRPDEDAFTGGAGRRAA